LQTNPGATPKNIVVTAILFPYQSHKGQARIRKRLSLLVNPFTHFYTLQAKKKERKDKERRSGKGKKNAES
jgi:hypothetical protein